MCTHVFVISPLMWLYAISWHLNPNGVRIELTGSFQHGTEPITKLTCLDNAWAKHPMGTLKQTLVSVFCWCMFSDCDICGLLFVAFLNPVLSVEKVGTHARPVASKQLRLNAHAQTQTHTRTHKPTHARTHPRAVGRVQSNSYQMHLYNTRFLQPYPWSRVNQSSCQSMVRCASAHRRSHSSATSRPTRNPGGGTCSSGSFSSSFTGTAWGKNTYATDGKLTKATYGRAHIWHKLSHQTRHPCICTYVCISIGRNTVLLYFRFRFDLKLKKSVWFGSTI